MGEPMQQPTSARVQLRRGAKRGDYDPATIVNILDVGLLAHVAVMTADGPLALPMAYGHDGRELFVHGAVANGILNAAIGHDIGVTVTVLDGLIVGRSPLHNSATYRSVVIRGTARKVDDVDEKVRALQLISDHVIANWDRGRAPTATEIRSTLVIAVALTEASAKIRTGGPIDEPEDLEGPHWAGNFPIVSRFAAPMPSPDLPDGIATPPNYLALEGRALGTAG